MTGETRQVITTTHVRAHLHQNTPESVRDTVWCFVDEVFRDVHAILQLPPAVERNFPQFHYTLAAGLLAVIGGVSRLMYDPSGTLRAGPCFTCALQAAYPWDDEPQASLSRKEQAGILYKHFRNPLVHALGIDHIGGEGRITRLFRMGLWRASELDRLASPRFERPAGWPPTVDVTERTIDIQLECLYWGVRRMIYNLSCDTDRMRKAEKVLDPLIKTVNFDFLRGVSASNVESTQGPSPIMLWSLNHSTWPWNVIE